MYSKFQVKHDVVIIVVLHSWELNYISPFRASFKMMFLFPRWDMWVPWRNSMFLMCEQLPKIWHHFEIFSPNKNTLVDKMRYVLFADSTCVRLFFINSCLIKLASFKTFQAKTLWKSFDLSPHLSATFAGLQNSPFTPWRSATQSRPCCLFALEKIYTFQGIHSQKCPSGLGIIVLYPATCAWLEERNSVNLDT